jgi:hypothetical protein
MAGDGRNALINKAIRNWAHGHEILSRMDLKIGNKDPGPRRPNAAGLAAKAGQP